MTLKIEGKTNPIISVILFPLAPGYKRFISLKSIIYDYYKIKWFIYFFIHSNIYDLKMYTI